MRIYFYQDGDGGYRFSESRDLAICRRAALILGLNTKRLRADFDENLPSAPIEGAWSIEEGILVASEDPGHSDDYTVYRITNPDGETFDHEDLYEELAGFFPALRTSKIYFELSS